MKRTLRLLGVLAVAFLLLSQHSYAVLITNLFDPLDDTSHFIESQLQLLNNFNSTVSLVHTNVNPPNDQTAVWGLNGSDAHILLTTGSRLQLVPVDTVVSGTTTGTWGFDILWFDASDAYIGQATYQSFTNLTGLQTYFITSSVPVGAVSWAPQFRVFDQLGNQPLVANYGFTFDTIYAAQIPEPSVLGLLTLGAAVWAYRRRRQPRG